MFRASSGKSVVVPWVVMDMEELRRWYDGYELPHLDEAAKKRTALRCYAPFSVARACQRHLVGPCGASSEAFRSLLLYVDMGFDGLRQSIVQAVGGASVSVNTYSLENDLHDVRSADDALTLLCHLGYLAYDADAGRARVPSEEVRAELRRAVAESRHVEVARIARESDALLRATWDMDEDAVVAFVAHAHDEGCVHVFYNDDGHFERW